MPNFIKKIVITGGPCAGKSTAMARIEQELTEKGYKVLIIAETATELIMGNISPFELSPEVFQEAVCKLQMQKEASYLMAAQAFAEKDGKDVVIIHDRGINDNKAYMSPELFTTILEKAGTTEVQVRESYDAVFHLVTAADGAERYYTLENNQARYESTLEMAIDTDRKTLNVWGGHPHHRKIDNSTDFNGKMDKLMLGIYQVLGIPAPVEIERKFLVHMPNIEQLCEKYHVSEVDIVQTYLQSEPDIEARVRQRSYTNPNTHSTEASFYYTEKVSVPDSKLTRLEREKRISLSEYASYLLKSDTDFRQVIKTRYSFIMDEYSIELDVYPFWNDRAIVEVELTDEQQSVDISKEFRIIKEVTDLDDFKNKSLARID